MGAWRNEIVFGVAPLLLSGVIVVRQCKQGFLQCGALLVAACATDYVLYLAFRDEPDQGLYVSWDDTTGLLSWGPAGVRLPAGFRYERERGMHTLMGRFTSPDGAIIVVHDIGEFGGEHAGTGGAETLRYGSRVRISPQGVAFPDSGCAVFYLETDNAGGRTVINAIAHSFRPANSMWNWLRPFPPELLRSDCRSRFRVPFV